MTELEQLQSALKAENNTLLAENAQLKAHNRQLVEATKESLALHQNWRSTAEPEELTYYSEHKLVIDGLVEALQSPPAKLALAEAEVLRLLPEYLEASKTQDYGEYFDEFLVSKFDPAVEAMQEAKGDA